MKSSLFCLLLGLVFLSSCGGSTEPTSEKEYSYFVTKLGNDTLALERFKISGDTVIAHVLLRSPSSSLSSYRLELDPQDGVDNLLQFKPTKPDLETEASRIDQRIYIKEDSLYHEIRGRNGWRKFSMLNQKGALPFIDMVHWPFDLAFQAAAKVREDSIHQMLVTGRRLSDFIIYKVREDSFTLRHPSRGVMGATVDPEGRLIKLDAGLTTRKLVVEAVYDMDFESMAADFLERDKNGSPFGALSGAVKQDFAFGGSEFSVSYGSPLKRGRQIFGGIVPYGKRWRTGANRAAHFSTSKPLSIGKVQVPAGEYTLFSIPEANGGTLIINKQTGQNGRSYDEARDLARVPMTRSTQEEVTESFTIQVVENGEGGSIQLIWDQTVYSVDFSLD